MGHLYFPSLRDLFHSGIPHEGSTPHSGRYPWGSGDKPFQHATDFLSTARRLEEQFKKEFPGQNVEKEVSQGLGLSIREYRQYKSIAINENREAERLRVIKLKEKGYSNMAIERETGIPESTVRNYLKSDTAKKNARNQEIADTIQRVVDKKGYVDIGAGTELSMDGVTRNRFDTAVKILEDKGYTVHNIKIEQLGTGHNTTVKVLAPPGTEWKDIQNNPGKVHSFEDFENKDATTMSALGMKFKPAPLSSDRLMIRYAEDGGIDKDGVIELRRGVEDISLGASRYSQVRINVNDKLYLKGMAMYSDNMPPGVDVVFNTNKTKGTSLEKVLKPMKTIKDKDGTEHVDWDNPFGATVKPFELGGQRVYTDADGKEHLSVINKVNDEGDWMNWTKKLPSQFLSKQSRKLAQQQLNLSYADKAAQFDEIQSITNDTLRKKELIDFGESCDAAATHLKAAALPRQGSYVILPFTSVKETEVYAPRYKNGEQVALIRYPHAGTFEIPILTVNNNRQEPKKTISPTAVDAIGINAKVAQRLSGADFDGDSVTVIPLSSANIKSTPALKDLKGFDPSSSYPGYEGMKVMTKQQTQIEMGKASNLITDMSLAGAKPEELARAVKYSMVVIDAHKHELNWKQAAKDCGISELKKEYQGSAQGGASTIISRSKSPVYVNERKDTYKINPQTGEKEYLETGRTYLKTITSKTKPPETVVLPYQTKTTQMESHSDAMDLVSPMQHPMEIVYADYANKMKALGNTARREAQAIETPKRNSSAAKVYANEVASLDAKLTVALRNSPKERQAQLVANSIVAQKKKDNPDMDKDTLKRVKNQALASARTKYGANKKEVLITITDKEWEAIQAGAISSSKLEQIFNNTDSDRLKQLATPKDYSSLTQSEIALIKSMKRSNYTIAEIADRLGKSTSTISKAINS